jgi:hypothetical protein
MWIKTSQAADFGWRSRAPRWSARSTNPSALLRFDHKVPSVELI